MTTPHLLLSSRPVVGRGRRVRKRCAERCTRAVARDVRKQATTFVRAPVPLLSGMQSLGVDVGLAPMIDRAYATAQ